MFSRSTASLSRSAPRATAALRQQSVFAASKRSVATSAHEAEYESGESAGIKFANQNAPGLTGSLSVVVKAGSRYQPAEGFADVLEKFAFK
ncbi:ubiquinol-cytochrome c reductase core subunit 1, partial [Ascosphaera atra]